MELGTGFHPDMEDLMQYIGQDDEQPLWVAETDNNEDDKYVHDTLQNKHTHFPDPYEETGMFFDQDWMTEKFDFSSEFDDQVLFQNDLTKSGENLTTSEESGGKCAEELVVLDAGTSENTSGLSVDCEEDSQYEEGPGNDYLLSNIDEATPIDTLSATDVDEVLMTDDVTSLEDGPSSPEQNVPSIETLDMVDVVKLLCAGNHVIDKQKLYNSLKKIKATNCGYIKPINVQATSISKENMLTHIESEGKAKQKQSFKMSRRTPEQKERKRLQNRNAATRYRTKKRGEQEELNSQCTELEKENKSLKDKVTSLQHETDYLKKLIIDVYQKL